METSRLLTWLVLALAGGAFSFWVYLRREIPVPGRPVLAALRTASLALALLILVNPSLPGGGPVAPGWTLTDVSPSMSVPQQGESRETQAPADRLAGTRPDPDDRTAEFGADGTTRLAPGLSRALEAGAGRVRVRSDLRLEDAVTVEALLRSAGVPVEFEDAGGPLVNAGISGMTVDGPRSPGGPVTGEVSIRTEGVDTVRVRARVAGATALDTTVSVPADGTVRVPLALQPPDTTGAVPVEVTVATGGDGYPDDDARTRIVALDAGSGEVVLVSTAPDWEPRFLLPVLAQVTGLRVQGFLRVGEDSWLPMRDAPGRQAGSAVARAVSDARLVVVHGPAADLPEAVSLAASGAPAVLLLPAASQAGGRSGEWYLAGEAPASPLAGELVGALAPGLPPLLAARGEVDGPGVPVLEVQRAGAGVTVPALVLEEDAGARSARGLAQGFWRWAFRGPEGRALYRRLWSGVARWLLAAPAALEGVVGLGPVATVVAPGEATAWRAGPARGRELSVTLVPVGTGSDPAEPGGPGEGSREATSATVSVDSVGRAVTTAPGQPGVYRWEARVEGSDGAGRVARGLLVVEASTGDLLPGRAVSLLDMEPAADPVGAAGDGRPLRTHPLPYLLLVILLSVEWVGRRRSGLR